MYNAVGEGPSSAPQEVFVGEAGMFPLRRARGGPPTSGVTLLSASALLLVPTSPPQNVVVQSSTATQLDVTWDPPPLDAQNGDIQGYKVSIICFLSMQPGCIAPVFCVFLRFSLNDL